MSEVTTRRLSLGKNISETERVASLIGGGALVAWGLARGKWEGVAMLAAGGVLMYRGATGHCDIYQALGLNSARRGGRNVSVPYELGVRVDQSITIGKPPAEVYQFWRNLENLPKFMENVQSVTEIDNRQSHWVIKGPTGPVEWQAEIINDKENELIGWRSLSGSGVGNAGSVHFKEVPGGATTVTVELQYDPPGGVVGAAVAKLLGYDPERQIAEDLSRLKQMLETGEGGAKPKQTPKKGWNRDVVTTASEDSFPASDPPSWTPERV
jgi:uncharacterized membrane protein